MLITAADIAALSNHWAVAAIPLEDRNRALSLADEHLVERAVGEQIEFSFASEVKHIDLGLMEKVLAAYELAAVEGLDSLCGTTSGDVEIVQRTQAASYIAFAIMRSTPIPEPTAERIYHVLKISAMAYCGDRWTDLRRYYEDNNAAIEIPSVAGVPWDVRVLYRLFECWVLLFRKRGWNDLDRVSELVSSLRDEQKTFETSSFDEDASVDGQFKAFRLIALYHLAKASETLAQFLSQGGTGSIFADLEKHFESAIRAAQTSGDPSHEMLLHWLYAAACMMVRNSLWWGTRSVNSRVTKFVRELTSRQNRSMYELLPPQRAALLEKNLLDPAKTAVVVDMPTSGGKTLLAQFRILQALNQFSDDQGWVAYIAPTRALVSQITRRLRRDFSPIGINVEQLSAAINVDAFEDELLKDATTPFHVIVATPEKLSLVIKNGRVGNRPLALVVVDEAQNIENESRGLRLELLLSTVKQDCPHANFLLLMPFVEGSAALSKWLAQDAQAGNAISLGTTAWRPNERIVGIYRAVKDTGADWHMEYETLTCTPKALKLHGSHRVGGNKPLNLTTGKVISKARQINATTQTAIVASALSGHGTSIAVGQTVRASWAMARLLCKHLPVLESDEQRELVIKFVKSEIGPDYELVAMLERGVGVHNAGLSDEIRSLMEWLAENGKLKVLCATSTIAQGIDFPVTSVFLASRFVPGDGHSTEMKPREFWNLVGRAGRIGQDSVGVVGLADGNKPDEIRDYVSRQTGELASMLVRLMDELEKQGDVHDLKKVIWQDQWEDLRCYIAHLYAQKNDLDATLAESEQLLRQTFGYSTLRNANSGAEKAAALLEATKSYVQELAGKPAGVAQLADKTGFSPEGVSKALSAVSKLENKLRPDDWMPESLFGSTGRVSDVFGAMLKVPQLQRGLEDVGGRSQPSERLGEITRDWVNGEKIVEITKKYFASDDSSVTSTEQITEACKAIYRSIVNNGTWGMSALSHLGQSDNLTSEQERRINAIPAMVYHGVNTEEAVLMRMNSVPRAVATPLGSLYKQRCGNSANYFSAGHARNFISSLNVHDWSVCSSASSGLSGEDNMKIWKILSGDVALSSTVAASGDNR